MITSFRRTAVWDRSRDSLYANTMSWMDGVVAGDGERVARFFEAIGEETMLEYKINHPGKTVRWIRARTFPVRNMAGITHDFNNLLTTINGYFTIVLKDIQDNEQTSQDLAEIKKTSERAAILTRQLLAFTPK